MPDEPPSEFTAKIAAAYLRRHQVPPDELAALISTIHQAFAGLGKPTPEAEGPRTPAVSIRRSVHRDHVICLDCGWRGQTLRRHLTAAHGLTVEEYRARWKLLTDHPMTAPGYSEQRSTMAKRMGLGRASAPDQIATVPEVAAATPPQPSPRQRGRPRKARSSSVTAA